MLPQFAPLAGVAPRPNGRAGPYDTSRDAGERGRRLGLFREVYGQDLNAELLPIVEQRLEALCALLTERAEAGESAYRRLVDEGRLDPTAERSTSSGATRTSGGPAPGRGGASPGRSLLVRFP